MTTFILSHESIYTPLDRKSKKSTQKRTQKSNRAQKSPPNSNKAQKSTQKCKFTQKSNELKKELKKVKSNVHLTQKRTQTSSQKCTQQSKGSYPEKKSASIWTLSKGGVGTMGYDTLQIK